jgi:hypothetical protein
VDTLLTQQACRLCDAVALGKSLIPAAKVERLRVICGGSYWNASGACAAKLQELQGLVAHLNV